MEATRRGGLRARTCQTARKNKRNERQQEPRNPHLTGSFGYKQGFISHLKSFLSSIKKKCQNKTVSRVDEFDKQYGFLLKHNIVEEKQYNEVKSHYFQYHQASS